MSDFPLFLWSNLRLPPLFLRFHPFVRQHLVPEP